MPKTINQLYNLNEFIRRCPWCGEVPEVMEEQLTTMDAYYISPRVDLRNRYTPDICYRVKCLNSRCSIQPEANRVYFTERDAVRAWNKGLKELKEKQKDAKPIRGRDLRGKFVSRAGGAKKKSSNGD